MVTKRTGHIGSSIVDKKNRRVSTKQSKKTLAPVDGETAKRLQLGKARLWDLMFRCNQEPNTLGSVCRPMGYEVVHADFDWAYSDLPSGFKASDSMSVKFHASGVYEDWTVSPGSEDYVFERVEEYLDETKKLIEEEQDIRDQRAKALERAQRKLSEEDLKLLKLI